MVLLSSLTDWLCHYHSISLPLLPTVQLLLYWAMRKRFSISLKIKNRKRDIRRFRTKSFVTFFRSFYDSRLPWGRVIICYKILPPPPLYPLKFKGLYFFIDHSTEEKISPNFERKWLWTISGGTKANRSSSISFLWRCIFRPERHFTDEQLCPREVMQGPYLL